MPFKFLSFSLFHFNVSLKLNLSLELFQQIDHYPFFTTVPVLQWKSSKAAQRKQLLLLLKKRKWKTIPIAIWQRQPPGNNSEFFFWSRSEIKYTWTKGLEFSSRGKPGLISSTFKTLMELMLDCTLPVLEKERKLFLQKVRFVLNFLRRIRFLVKLKIFQAGNWRNLWKSKADKSFWITKPLFCVIQYNGSSTGRWWISNQSVDMRNRSAERCWKKTSRLIRRE